MVHLAWIRDYSVNVDEMDSQHKKILALLNDILIALDKQKSFDVIKPIIDELEKYAHTHFTAEEQHMETCGFEELATQKEAHQFFIKKVSDFKTLLLEGGNPSLEILGFLKNWFVNHIQGLDTKYTDCFHRSGIY